jgi:soluble lytic murein transglycosylase-like protein
MATHPRPPAGSGLSEIWNAALEDYVGVVAARHGVPKNLVLAVIAVESQFDTMAVSSRGALGLMQLMPATAEILGVSDPFDPRENIDGGVRHLRAMMDRFDNDLPRALAAYNAGAQAVIRHRGVPPYRETRQYVSRILRRLDRDDAMSLQKRDRRGLRSSLGPNDGTRYSGIEASVVMGLPSRHTQVGLSRPSQHITAPKALHPHTPPLA